MTKSIWQASEKKLGTRPADNIPDLFTQLKNAIKKFEEGGFDDSEKMTCLSYLWRIEGIAWLEVAEGRTKTPERILADFRKHNEFSHFIEKYVQSGPLSPNIVIYTIALTLLRFGQSLEIAIEALELKNVERRLHDALMGDYPESHILKILWRCRGRYVGFNCLMNQSQVSRPIASKIVAYLYEKGLLVRAFGKKTRDDNNSSYSHYALSATGEQICKNIGIETVITLEKLEKR